MLYAALDEGTAGFLGAEHFGCISRMLGYQGVAMCGDEMLKTLSSQVWMRIIQSFICTVVYMLNVIIGVDLGYFVDAMLIYDCQDHLTLTAQLADMTKNLDILMEGMPKVCKLPLFDYKASGCLAFYHLRLIDVIGHKELQTNVFHSFREIGNAVICFLLIEEGQVLTCLETIE